MKHSRRPARGGQPAARPGNGSVGADRTRKPATPTQSIQGTRDLFAPRASAHDMPLSTIAQLLGGEVVEGRVLAPGPGKPASDRSLIVRAGRGLPAGLIIYDCSDPWADTMANRLHVCRLLNVIWPPRSDEP